MNIMKKDKRTIALFVLPALFIFTVFGLGPLLPPVFYSLFNYKNLKLGEFIGLQNYVKAFSDKSFAEALLNNLKVVGLQFLIGMPLSFLGAVLISAQGPKIRRFVKTASFLPSILSVTVICMSWYMMLQPRWGVIESLMNILGLGKYFQPWLSKPKSAFLVITFTMIWQYIGYNMVLFFSGLKAIPEQYFEAATLDGASMFQQLIHITIPLMQETFKFMFVIMLTGSMGLFSHVKLMTNGSYTVKTAVYYISQVGFNKLDFGYGYALTVIYTIITFLAVTIISRVIAKTRLEYV